MKAIRQHRYGPPDVLRLEDVDRPECAEDRIIVRVRAASVNALDWHQMRGQPFPVRMSDGLRRPKSSLIGVDVAGVVEEVGATVTTVRPGDQVFGTTAGAFAEFVSCREVRLVPMPTGSTFEQAAAVPVAGTTALQALRDHGQVRPGQKVLINGATGGVGTFAVQIAKAFGADVTGVCSPGKVDLVRSLGADDVIDYSREDFTARRQHFDLIVDIAGTRSLSACRRALKPNGTYVVVGGPGGRWIHPADRLVTVGVVSHFVSQRLVSFLAKIEHDDLFALKELVEAGKVRPVIDRTYPLHETAEAIRYLEAGHASGKVIITV